MLPAMASKSGGRTRTAISGSAADVGDEMTYTYDQVLAYEAARKPINSHIADCSAAMADEEAKAEASADRLAEIRRR